MLYMLCFVYFLSQRKHIYMCVYKNGQIETDSYEDRISIVYKESWFNPEINKYAYMT